jgi:ribosomal protein L11 methyltransferase
MSSLPSWLAVTVTVSLQHADAVANRMIELGCSGIVEQDSPAMPGCVELTGYGAEGPPAAGMLADLHRYLRDIAPEEDAVWNVRTEAIPDEDWNKKWKSFFEPVKVSPRIVIKPSWRTYRPRPGEIVIELDPGMAFGTGTHPSTSMCLRAIDEACRGMHDPGQASLLDVGTGSGILALAAAGLGIGVVRGIDYDYQAVVCAEKNAALNGMTGKVAFGTTPLERMCGTYTIVVANILPHVLIAMRDDLVARTAANGILVLSGILSTKAPEVADAFTGQMTPAGELHEDEWACLLFRKS